MPLKSGSGIATNANAFKNSVVGDTHIKKDSSHVGITSSKKHIDRTLSNV